ncbi:hypothetical protein E0W60_29770 (plasmid) [Cupriavidus oxalaticus]|uniref:Uncharacterized protein n=1 Tax=Cupriavidus oxalaticus TaxID=96344 RepID=A0A4P7LNL7_9BURK|nr:hypothetical protein E0W60_29770 [Cupriavidus oxalaticus]TDF63141.1 hypothetical protein E1J61_25590 [Cupriavidus sp. L7L]
MLIDTRRVEQDSVLHTTVCIIGAGLAGITLALEMQQPGIDAGVPESGSCTGPARSHGAARRMQKWKIGVRVCRVRTSITCWAPCRARSGRPYRLTLS